MEIDINALMAEAEAIIADNKKPPAPKVKLDSIKRKKKPVIKSGINYHYDPATYQELHKKCNWYLVDTEEKAIEVVNHLRYNPILAVDTETRPLTQYKTAIEVPLNIVRRYVKKNANDVPFGISVSDGICAWFFIVGFDIIAELLIDPKIIKIFANAKYDLHELENIGIKIAGKVYDVQLLIKLFNENLSSYRLKDLSVKFIDKESNKWEIMKDNWMADNRTNDWTAVPKELMADYGAGDAFFTFELFIKFYKYMIEFNMVELYETESELQQIVAYPMERVGFKIDRAYLEALRPEFEKEIADGLDEIYTIAGKIININSSQQVVKMLIEQGVPESDIKYNPDTGNPIFDKVEKERLAKRYDIVNKIQEVGKLEKLLSTYVNNILSTLPADDRTHCNINTMEATTGRMSITDPPLQTLPKKDKRIRRAFIPGYGEALFFFDLDQIEYRLFAHYCRDENLIAAIKRGWDVHKATAAIIFHKVYDEVSEDERSHGKTDNFALVYGVGNEHFSELISTKDHTATVEEARAVKKEYFKNLPNAKVFLDTVQETIREKGYVRNIYNRRRRLSKDEAYKGPNALIQGCAADFVKVKAVAVQRMLQKYEAKTKGQNIVHDELIYAIPLHEIEWVAPLIKECIDDDTTFRVPITCGCEWSLLSWGEKMDYDLTKTLKENIEMFVEKYPRAREVIDRYEQDGLV